jgi:hypothetical protein
MMKTNRDPSELDTLPMFEAAKPIPMPVEELHSIVFCHKCGCGYMDGCKEHLKGNE